MATSDELDLTVRHEGALDAAITMGLYLSIVLLTLLVGFGGDAAPVDEVQLLWGTSLGLVLAHSFALRLAGVVARAHPRLPREDVLAGSAQLASAIAVTSLASVPYLLDITTLDASSASSLLLLAVIGSTGFFSVRRAGRTVARALAFAVIVVTIALVVVAVKYSLTH